MATAALMAATLAAEALAALAGRLAEAATLVGQVVILAANLEEAMPPAQG